VTPLGVRDGDPEVVAALVHRRGAAVLAYCEEVAAPGEGVAAAADSFARFRETVGVAPDAGSLDAEGELVRAMRFAAADRAADPEGDGTVLRRAAGRGETSRLAPTLLAARAEGDLGPEDEERLERLLARSGEARRAADRMRRAEASYTDPAAALPPRAAGAIVGALLAPPAVGGIAETLRLLGHELGWGPEQVQDAVAAT
jgi:hypothetical protein